MTELREKKNKNTQKNKSNKQPIWTKLNKK